MKKTKLISGIVVVLIGVFGILGVILSPDSAHSIDKKINFSHLKHKDLAECSTCHTAETSESANDNLRPKPEVCASCHEEKDVRTYWNIEESVKLTDVVLEHKNRHLIFSHKFHVTTAKAECQSCHGALLTEKEGVSGYPDMSICFECHNNANKTAPVSSSSDAMKTGSKFVVTKACEACHTTLAGLYPKSHRYSNYMQDHGKFAMVGGAEQECAACHSQNFCQECHSPYDNVPAPSSSKNFAMPYSPRGETVDNPDRLTLQKRHNLTYRYTHGFDARVQSSRCFTCHEQETFCTPCHRNGYDAAGVRIVPQSHQIAGFVTLGGNKSMNRHAKLAAMNIESCVTCHNVEGADPICATCHSNGFVPKGGD